MSVIVDNITKYYGEQCVLDGVSFSLKEGEITGFIGANGAGKTTTMDIITGYQNQWEGAVQIYGHDVRNQSIEAKRMVGYLPEHNPLEAKLYVKEYLSYVAGIYLPLDQVKSAVDTVIEEVGLAREKHKKIGMLSKGYKQRVGLAQALIHEPKVLILDEPTTGLDPQQLDEIRALIKRISRDKIVMLSTHIMQEAEALCDRILMLKNGRLIKDFHVNKNFESVEGSLQRVHIAFTEPITLPELSFASHIEIIDEKSYIVHSREQEDIRVKLFQFAKDNSLPLVHLSRVQDSFENKVKDYLAQNP